MKDKKTLSLFLILFFYLSIPVILWILGGSFFARFGGWPQVFTSIGQLLGLLGLSLYALNLFLSTRLRIIENIFNGLNKVYIRHHFTGKLALILLVFHPLSLITSYLPSIENAKGILPYFSGSLSINIGAISLLLLITLLALTIFCWLPYNIWKNIHKFLGIPFFLASFHVLTIDSDVSVNIPLRIFVFIILLIGIVSYFYKTILNKFLVKKYEYTVDKVNVLNKDIIEVILKPEKKEIKFSPGQFAFVSIENNHLTSEEHPFSITSSEFSQKLQFVIKMLGDYTSKLVDLKPGTKVLVEGPYGKFGQKISGKTDQIWIAGGIGITPFLSMAKSITKERNIILYYSISDKKEAVFGSELKKISLNNSNFNFFLWITSEKGRLPASSILGKRRSLENIEIFICGPIPMIRTLKNQFIDLGVKQDFIHSEEFQMVC